MKAISVTGFDRQSGPIGRVLSSLFTLLVTPDQYDFWARQFGSIDGWSRCYARVHSVSESADGVSLTLRANRHQTTVLQGETCDISVEIGGRKRSRTCRWETRDGFVLLTVPRAEGDAVYDFLARRVASGQRLELTAASRVLPQTVANADTVPVTLTRSGKVVNVARNTSLLEALEQAGVKPSYGCRRGVCNRCSCARVRGQTADIGSGESSSEPGTPIRICVHRAESPLELDL